MYEKTQKLLETLKSELQAICLDHGLRLMISDTNRQFFVETARLPIRTILEVRIRHDLIMVVDHYSMDSAIIRDVSPHEVYHKVIKNTLFQFALACATYQKDGRLGVSTP